jgi:hypothetical protein
LNNVCVGLIGIFYAVNLLEIIVKTASNRLEKGFDGKGILLVKE